MSNHMSLSRPSITWYWSKNGDVLRLESGKVTADLAESNGSLPPGDDFKSPAG